MKKTIVTLALFVTLITLPNTSLFAQDSILVYPAALTNVEFRLGAGNLTSDFKGLSRNSDQGRYAGFGISFQSNLFRNPSEAKQFRSADFLGLGFNLGVGKTGLWAQGKVDIGWQFHYAINPTIDLGIRTYATAIYNKISYTGVQFHPSVRYGRLYADFNTGIPIALGGETSRRYFEGNFRLLLQEKHEDTDRWFLGIKYINMQVRNNDKDNAWVALKQYHITAGLIF